MSITPGATAVPRGEAPGGPPFLVDAAGPRDGLAIRPKEHEFGRGRGTWVPGRC